MVRDGDSAAMSPPGAVRRPGRVLSGAGQPVSARIAVIDNDPLSLAALTSLLRQALPEIHIVWTAASAQRCLELCGYGPFVVPDIGSGKSPVPGTADGALAAGRPQILLIDMSMPDMDGITLTRRIREQDGRIKILAMTSFPLTEYAADVALAGAQGIVSKGRPGEIITAIRTLARPPTLGTLRCDGDSGSSNEKDDGSEARSRENRSTSSAGAIEFLSPSAAFRREAGRRPSGIERFTPVENRIARLCADGATTQEIADSLGVSAGTVTTHIQRMCAKIGARNRVRLVAL